MNQDKNNLEPRPNSLFDYLVGLAACLALFVIAALTLDVSLLGADHFHPLLFGSFFCLIYLLGKSIAYFTDPILAKTPLSNSIPPKQEQVSTLAGLFTPLLLTFFLSPAAAWFLSLWIGRLDTFKGRIAIGICILTLVFACAYLVSTHRLKKQRD